MQRMPSARIEGHCAAPCDPCTRWLCLVAIAPLLATLACKRDPPDRNGALPMVALPSGPLVQVDVELVGRSASEVEVLVGRPIVAGVTPVAEHVELRALDGRARVDVELPADVDPIVAVRTVHEAIGLDRLPDDASPPMLTRVDPNAIVLFAIVDPRVSDRIAAVEQVRSTILGTPGVRTVLQCGDEPEVLRVRVDAFALPRFALALDDVVDALEDAESHTGVLAGTSTSRSLLDLPVGDVQLRQIAAIERGPERPPCSRGSGSERAPALLRVGLDSQLGEAAADRLREATASIAAARVSVADPRGGNLVLVWSESVRPLDEATANLMLAAATSAGSSAWLFDDPFAGAWLFVAGNSDAARTAEALRADRRAAVHAWPWPFEAIVARACSQDFRANATVAGELAAVLVGTPGVEDVAVDAARERPSRRFEIDRAALARAGLSVSSVARLASLVRGDAMIVGSFGGSAIELRLDPLVPGEGHVRGSSGELVPLASVVSWVETTDITPILSVDGVRCADVRVLLSSTDVRADVEARIRANHRPPPDGVVLIFDPVRER